MTWLWRKRPWWSVTVTPTRIDLGVRFCYQCILPVFYKRSLYHASHRLRGCQSSPCLTSPPTFIAPVEPRLLVAYLAGPHFYTYLGFWCCSTPRRLLLHLH